MPEISYQGHKISVFKNGLKYGYSISGKIVNKESSELFDGMNFMICVAKSEIDKELKNYHVICI